ncbi:mitochondrial carrier [Tilletiaria anomala UBC 951]|uniref:Mitochondrial carrier n=1 Tax=Tilletiaria anomala (strain ATCC 24038 / CBS 436.72 / UBC 951) TaxID=1037660 RepID=A0A066VPH8_TILAU|nr:mitochondrial carrier [Tilletiaria anomala UBC 951]KDN43657.1 mitochondrial carrier [Tilletiaria anomala UBC 951]
MTDVPAAPSAWVDLLAGTVGGIASLLASHPFDTIKTRLQAQAPQPDVHDARRLSGSTAPVTAAARPGPAAAPPTERGPLLALSPDPRARKSYASLLSISASAPLPSLSLSLPSSSSPSSSSSPCFPPAQQTQQPHYTSATQAFRVIVRDEKFIGLYKGVCGPMLGVALMNAAIFGAYSLCLQMLQSQQHLFTSSPAPSPHASHLPAQTPALPYYSHDGSVYLATIAAEHAQHHHQQLFSNQQQQQQPTLTQIFIAGCASGLISALITTPIDLVKIQEQVQVPLQPPSRTRIRLAASSSFKGISTAAAVAAPPTTLSSRVWGIRTLHVVRQLWNEGVRSSHRNALDSLGNTTLFAAASSSPSSSTALVPPLDARRPKRGFRWLPLLSTSPSPSPSPSRWHWLHGIRAFYRGYAITALRDLGYGPYFLTYELLNRSFLALFHQQHQTYGFDAAALAASGGWTQSMMENDAQLQPQQQQQLTSLELAVSGALAGCIAWASTFPLDVIKTRIQAAGADPSAPSSASTSSIVHVVRETYRREGLRAFFKGLGPTMLRAVPANAVLFVAYEATKSALLTHHHL